MSLAEDVAHDLSAIRKKFQNTNALDATLRQLVSQLIQQNENEAVFERWSSDVEPKLLKLASDIREHEQTIADLREQLAAQAVERDQPDDADAGAANGSALSVFGQKSWSEGAPVQWSIVNSASDHDSG